MSIIIRAIKLFFCILFLFINTWFIFRLIFALIIWIKIFIKSRPRNFIDLFNLFLWWTFRFLILLERIFYLRRYWFFWLRKFIKIIEIELFFCSLSFRIIIFTITLIRLWLLNRRNMWFIKKITHILRFGISLRFFRWCFTPSKILEIKTSFILIIWFWLYRLHTRFFLWGLLNILIWLLLLRFLVRGASKRIVPIFFFHLLCRLSFILLHIFAPPRTFITSLTFTFLTYLAKIIKVKSLSNTFSKHITRWFL